MTIISDIEIDNINYDINEIKAAILNNDPIEKFLNVIKSTIDEIKEKVKAFTLKTPVDGAQDTGFTTSRTMLSEVFPSARMISAFAGPIIALGAFGCLPVVSGGPLSFLICMALCTAGTKSPAQCARSCEKFKDLAI